MPVLNKVYITLPRGNCYVQILVYLFRDKLYSQAPLFISDAFWKSFCPALFDICIV